MSKTRYSYSYVRWSGLNLNFAGQWLDLKNPVLITLLWPCARGSFLGLCAGCLASSRSLIERPREGPCPDGSACGPSNCCTCSPTPLMSFTCNFMAWNSLMASAAISCPLSVGWASKTDLQCESNKKLWNVYQNRVQLSSQY